MSAYHKGWEYQRLGDYHRNLDLSWSYAPTYLRKVKKVHSFINSLDTKSRIVDIACGEGVFVESFLKQGRDIQGIDLNYSSEFVRLGDVCDLPYENDSFDAAMFLDALEHIEFKNQPPALHEIYRVLKPGGQLLLAVPNLAHLSSRFDFFFRGQLNRTDDELNHVGERPFLENRKLIEDAHFRVVHHTGITFTVPIIYEKLICRKPESLRWLHDFLEPMGQLFPSLAMLSFFVCQKS